MVDCTGFRSMVVKFSNNNKGEINMETSVFEATCDDCQWHVVLLEEHVVQCHAESHMMETGHIVNIKEVI